MNLNHESRRSVSYVSPVFSKKLIGTLYVSSLRSTKKNTLVDVLYVNNVIFSEHKPTFSRIHCKLCLLLDTPGT